MFRPLGWGAGGSRAPSTRLLVLKKNLTLLWPPKEF